MNNFQKYYQIQVYFPKTLQVKIVIAIIEVPVIIDVFQFFITLRANSAKPKPFDLLETAYWNYFHLTWIDTLTHGGLGLTEVTPLMNQGLLIQFFDFLIAEVAKTFIERYHWKNFNCGQDTNDKDIFFLQNKFQIVWKTNLAKITWSHMCVFPLQHPRKGPD